MGWFKDGEPRKASEREAAKKATEIVARNSDAYAGDDYGAGRLTKDQKKSQEKHIPMKQAKGSKLGRSLWG